MLAVRSKLRLTRPIVQNVVVGCILFCLPGLYTALTGLGAGGGKSSSGVVANQTNAILYGLFTLFALLGGPIVNVLGPRLSMVLGGLGYPLYIGGLWYYDRTGATWFPLWAGAMLGMFCGVLWTCAGMVAYGYADEGEKGKFISIQWIIKAVGATVGAAIAIGVNFNNTKAGGVSAAVYIVFIVMQVGAIVFGALLVVDPRTVVRDDGTHLALFPPRTVKSQMLALARCFRNKPLLAMLPAMLVSEMALALLSTINGFYFNLRTRSLNNILYQGIQLFVPALVSYLLDCPRIPRRVTRGRLAAVVMGAIAVGACAGLYAWLDITGYRHIKKAPAADYTSAHWGGFIAIYLLFGCVYSGYQMVVEWTIAALSNDPTVLAQYSGVFHGAEALGMCVSFVLAAEKVAIVGQLSLQFGLYVLGTAGTLFTLAYYVQQTDYFTEANTIAPHRVEETILGAEIETADGRLVVTKETLERERQKEALAEKEAAAKAEKNKGGVEVTVV